MGYLGARNVHAGEAQAFLDLAFKRVLESVRVVVQARAIGVCGSQRTQSAKRDFRRGKIRLGLLHDASQRLKSFPVPIHNRAHARIERHAAQILEPCHARAFETAFERARENFSRLINRKRRAGIRPGDRA